jgi:multiple sugar transport system ATP-binding protein
LWNLPLSIPSELPPPEGGRGARGAKGESMASIRLENLTKLFGKTKAIDNLNLEVHDGEFFCILGPPGAGKTTLLRLVVGLEQPNAGNVYIDGEIVNDLHPSKRDIAMIFQNLALYPDKTVFENIAFPLRQQKVVEEDIKKRVMDVTQHLKIDWMLNRIPSQPLSGNQRSTSWMSRSPTWMPF